VAREGTWDAVNVSQVEGIPDGGNAFVTSFGANSRHVRSPVEATRVAGFSAYPGGSAGDPASPLYASRLGHWLTADYHPVLVTVAEVSARTTRLESFVPAR
jgi:penicillin amidase